MLSLRLVISREQLSLSLPRAAFRYQKYAVFNARKQIFDVVPEGIELTEDVLTQLQENELWRAFSSPPGEIISFTPQFCPQRFALKDALYERDLQVIDRLLRDICGNYAHHGVGYVEFSVGYKDLLLRPWVFAHLISYVETEHFKYNYLAAFTRDADTNLCIRGEWQAGKIQREAIIELVNLPDAPAEFIMRIERDEMYSSFSTALRKSSEAYERENNELYIDGVLSRRVRGLDLVGDEYGFPYVPFWRDDFWEFVQQRMRDRAEINRRMVFGLRPHMGEVTEAGYAQKLTRYPETENEAPLLAQRAYASHVRVMAHALERLMHRARTPLPDCEVYIPGFRFGHGVALTCQQILTQFSGEHHNLLIELCWTSNRHLLRGLDQQHPVLESEITRNRLVVCTDDDGIFSTECDCDLRHSLVAGEFCRMINGNVFHRLFPDDNRAVVAAIGRAHVAGFRYRGNARGRIPRHHPSQEDDQPSPRLDPRDHSENSNRWLLTAAIASIVVAGVAWLAQSKWKINKA